MIFMVTHGHLVRTCHGKPGISWKNEISFPGHGKSWNFSFGHGKVMEFCKVQGMQSQIVA